MQSEIVQNTTSPDCTTPPQPYLLWRFFILLISLVVSAILFIAAFVCILRSKWVEIAYRYTSLRGRYEVTSYLAIMVACDASFWVSVVIYSFVNVCAGLTESKSLTEIWYLYMVRFAVALGNASSSGACVFACGHALETALRIKGHWLGYWMARHQTCIQISLGLFVLVARGIFAFIEAVVIPVPECAGTLASFNYDYEKWANDPKYVVFRKFIRPLGFFSIPFVVLTISNFVIAWTAWHLPDDAAANLDGVVEDALVAYLRRLFRSWNAQSVDGVPEQSNVGEEQGIALLSLRSDQIPSNHEVVKDGETEKPAPDDNAIHAKQPEMKRKREWRSAILGILSFCGSLLVFWLCAIPNAIRTTYMIFDESITQWEEDDLIVDLIHAAALIAVGVRLWLSVWQQDKKRLAKEEKRIRSKDVLSSETIAE